MNGFLSTLFLVILFSVRCRLRSDNIVFQGFFPQTVIRARNAHLFYRRMCFLFPFKDPTEKFPPILIIRFLRLVFFLKRAIVITLHLLNHWTQLSSQSLCANLINREDFESTKQKQIHFNATLHPPYNSHRHRACRVS